MASDNFWFQEKCDIPVVENRKVIVSCQCHIIDNYKAETQTFDNEIPVACPIQVFKRNYPVFVQEDGSFDPQKTYILESLGLRDVDSSWIPQSVGNGLDGATPPAKFTPFDVNSPLGMTLQSTLAMALKDIFNQKGIDQLKKMERELQDSTRIPKSVKKKFEEYKNEAQEDKQSINEFHQAYIRQLQIAHFKMSQKKKVHLDFESSLEVPAHLNKQQVKKHIEGLWKDLENKDYKKFARGINKILDRQAMLNFTGSKTDRTESLYWRKVLTSNFTDLNNSIDKFPLNKNLNYKLHGNIHSLKNISLAKNANKIGASMAELQKVKLFNIAKNKASDILRYKRLDKYFKRALVDISNISKEEEFGFGSRDLNKSLNERVKEMEKLSSENVKELESRLQKMEQDASFFRDYPAQASKSQDNFDEVNNYYECLQENGDEECLRSAIDDSVPELNIIMSHLDRTKDQLVELNKIKERGESLEVVEVGIEVTKLASSSYVGEDDEVGDYLLELGNEALDLALGFVPVVNVGKDFVEMVSGVSLVTGEKLSPFERSLCVLGVATLGVGTTAKTSVKAALKIGGAALDAIKQLKVVKKGLGPIIKTVKGSLNYALKNGAKTRAEFIEYHLKGKNTKLHKLEITPVSSVKEIRIAYVKEVENLSNITSQMKNLGKTSHEIAKRLLLDRNRLKIKFRVMSPNDAVKLMEKRNF